MGNSLRCCLACVLPCGALDVIRIVHLNGHVEEITRPISAGEVLKDNPNHVLSKPSSQGGGGVVRRILILSPESDLKRGNIYFLIPSSSLPTEKKKKNRTHPSNQSSSTSSSSPSKKTKKTKPTTSSSSSTTSTTSGCDRYLTEILSEKKSSRRELRRERRCSKVSVWRPHLESISEDL